MNSDPRSITAESLIRDLERVRGIACAGCRKPVTSHHALMSVAMGFKDSIYCLVCLARRMEEQPEQLSDALVHYFLRRACYFEAWNWANRQAGLPEDKMIQAQSSGAGTFADARRFVPADSWDAGEQGCGELALELRMRLEKLKPGQIFQLTARDLGVPQDMPAWCLLTGHILLRAEHPVYWIERKA